MLSNMDVELIAVPVEVVFVVEGEGVKLGTVNTVDVMLVIVVAMEIAVLANVVSNGLASTVKAVTTKVYEELVLMVVAIVSDIIGTRLVALV